MKIISFSLLFTLGFINAKAQSYQGYRTGNYTGVNGVFFNPANVVDSRYSWDVNLVSASALLVNNSASLRLKDVIESFNGDSLLNQFKTSNRNNGMVHVDAHGPSFMFNTGKKSAIAFTTRAVAIANISDLDGRLISQVSDDVINGVTYPYSVHMQGKSGIAAHGYAEYGFTYGRVLANNTKHFLKAAVIGKYLSGAGNFFVQLDNFQANINNEPVTNRKYLSNTTGSIALGFGGSSFSDFEVSDVLKSKSSGIGADFGFIYELRAGNNHATDTLSNGSLRRDENKYKLKIGVALQNLGSISYNLDPARSAGYRANITGTQRFYLDALEDEDIDSFATVLNKYPQFFTKNGTTGGSYKVALPSVLAVDADYHLHNGFYVNASFQLPLNSKGGNAWNTYQYFTATVTPRFESRMLGLFVPVSYHDIAGVTAGAAVRIGPLFIGSGSIINAITGKTKQADVFIGLHIGGLFHNKARQQ